MAPGTEAPAEMHFYFPKFRALCMAENATHNLHNLLTLRGALVRDPHGWAGYLTEAIDTFSGRADVVFASHHWPTWGQDNIVEYLSLQRDLYAYLHDQTLRQLNQGYTGIEIAETFQMPPALEKAWHTHGYYGSVSHNVKAVYQRYMGWFDGNPATLDELPPEEAAKKFVDYMGGADAILKKAKEDYNQGNYRWVAQVVSKIVFADPNNQQARNLEADALEQLGYQAESGPWRNFYLTGAQELRNGVQKLPTPNTASPDTVRAMTPEMFFDYLGVHINGEKAGTAKAVFNIDLGNDGGKYKLELENGVLNHTADAEAKDADATIALDRATLNKIILKEETLKQAEDKGEVKVTGDGAKRSLIAPMWSADKKRVLNAINRRFLSDDLAISLNAGKTVHPDVRAIIIPGSQAVYLEAMKLGYVETFIQAGAVVSTPTCGPCLGGHMGIMAAGERTVATTNRNFRGRMGHVDSEVYLSGPAVAAASAITGRISSPKEVAV